MNEPAGASGRAEPSITNPSERKRYEISVDGQRAGFTAYVDHDSQRIFYHTEIDDRFTGEGLGSKLIPSALSDTRTAGKRVVPVCPFVAAYVKKHHEFDDILDPVTPQALDVVRRETR
jgi:predicted GNAT family acetyltransferase